MVNFSWRGSCLPPAILVLFAQAGIPRVLADALNTSTTIGIYNTSHTPSNLPWDTYNYCNGPHVNAAYYVLPESHTPGVKGSTLVYVNSMMRHHKRTPDNLYPSERALNPPSGWNCTDFIQMEYAGGAAQVYHETVIPSWHPFASQIWAGSCDEGHLTVEGLADAIQHGKDFWSVYHDTLGFLDNVSEDELYVHATYELLTQQVASGVLYGMNPTTVDRRVPIYAQPELIDAFVPAYACPAADAIRTAYQSVPAWSDHLVQHQALQDHLAEMLGVQGISAWLSWYDHFFDTFTSRTCNDHPLPCNASGACVTWEEAETVFGIGDWEYNYIWNAAQNASTYNSLTFSVAFEELSMNFKRFRAGNETHKMRFYVAHDGSMIRLMSGLGFGKVAPLRWPELGSEIVMEVWRDASADQHVRVMFQGTPFPSLEWVPLNDFISLLDASVVQNVFETCNTSSSSS
ncbi:phosphoglycerate mutase-like protein [Coniophora puteana RWD-64-598 SS2]|uniref:Phosphoglycerate mutase-like protein n=1 Tax=Coniophora puteana (strain RWD-64-598) TaxID=741705 RepID=A0A5M3MCM3_CONPW|nr:phosphoglycerate mutase-like protein [Coniophora puteana RWD-64-598 SS2]EIW76979.1 phosphoglycerate mutase-like protein [Coniophora puteana RWD-64-598 SS2]